MKAKSFYKNNKHNNMDPKEKENINEEELKEQTVQDENGEETTEKEEVALTEEEKLAQELEKANAEIEDQKDKYLRLSAEFDNYRKRTMKEKAELILNGGEKSISSILPIVDDFERALKNMETATDVASRPVGQTNLRQFESGKTFRCPGRSLCTIGRLSRQVCSAHT